jgi:hypothetical protein
VCVAHDHPRPDGTHHEAPRVRDGEGVIGGGLGERLGNDVGVRLGLTVAVVGRDGEPAVGILDDRAETLPFGAVGDRLLAVLGVDFLCAA